MSAVIFEQLNPGPCCTYLVASERTREAVLIDPVLDRMEECLKLLEQGRWRLSFIVDITPTPTTSRAAWHSTSIPWPPTACIT